MALVGSSWQRVHSNQLAGSRRAAFRDANPKTQKAHQANARDRFRVRNKISDELLDFVTAGPKLRKWYGQGERLPRDGGGPPPEEPEEEPKAEEPLVRDAVLVTDAESATGEQVLLQLILDRARVKALVRDTAAARTSFGEYVEPVSFDPTGRPGWQRALRDVATVICVGAPAALPSALAAAGVEHVVLLSSAGVAQAGGFSFGELMTSSEDKALRDPAREQALRGAGVPLTIIRAARIQDTRGGGAGITLVQGRAPASADMAVSREDLARVIVEAIQRKPQGVLEFQVVCQATSPATPDWDKVFTSLQEQPST